MPDPSDPLDDAQPWATTALPIRMTPGMCAAAVDALAPRDASPSEIERLADVALDVWDAAVEQWLGQRQAAP